MAKERSLIDKKYQWDLESLYPSMESWNKEFEAIEQQQLDDWIDIKSYRGNLDKSVNIFFDFIVKQLDIQRKIEKLYTYAHLRHDEDLTVAIYTSAYEKIVALLHSFCEAISWKNSEIHSLSESMLEEYLQNPLLQEYKNYIIRSIHLKPHTLTSEQERLIGAIMPALEGTERTFRVLQNADLQFPQILNEQGELLDLSQGLYSTYLQSKDRTLRHNAFHMLHSHYQKLSNTFCSLLYGEVIKNISISKARKYRSTLESALFPYNIDLSIYQTLIETVRKNISLHHRYIAFRKETLQFSSLHCYDLYCSLVPEVDLHWTFEEAVEDIIGSLEPLGDEYASIARRGLLQDGWVDRFENKNKRGGAYSSGCYDSSPYILLNFSGTFNDVRTLAHELGHSMHSWYSRKAQSYANYEYPIFLAEIASTFHEELLFHYLLKKYADKQHKAFFIHQRIDEIRSTFFRQTMFAEFEKTIYETVENRVPLTVDYLKELYSQLNRDYFGSDFHFDDLLSVEFMRIPHFYSHFYVYQYATGISIAHALFQMVHSDRNKDRYIQFISSGGSDYPLKILEKIGINMNNSALYEGLVQYFDDLVQDLQKLLIPVL